MEEEERDDLLEMAHFGDVDASKGSVRDEENERKRKFKFDLNLMYNRLATYIHTSPLFILTLTVELLKLISPSEKKIWNSLQ